MARGAGRAAGIVTALVVLAACATQPAGPSAPARRTAPGTLTSSPSSDSREDVNARQGDGSTPLQWAVYRGDVAEVARLIRAGADVSMANTYGATPMSLAAEIGNAAIIKLLLDAGADASSPNAEGQTALMAVARTGNLEAAKLLLKHGANVNAREHRGRQTALMWAAARKQPEMVKLLISKGADVNARGAVRDWPRKVTAEGRPKDMNRGGLTPLLYAAREGCVECARALQMLLDRGADVNAQLKYRPPVRSAAWCLRTDGRGWTGRPVAGSADWSPATTACSRWRTRLRASSPRAARC